MPNVIIQQAALGVIASVGGLPYNVPLQQHGSIYTVSVCGDSLASASTVWFRFEGERVFMWDGETHGQILDDIDDVDSWLAANPSYMTEKNSVVYPCIGTLAAHVVYMNLGSNEFGSDFQEHGVQYPDPAAVEAL